VRLWGEAPIEEERHCAKEHVMVKDGRLEATGRKGRLVGSMVLVLSLLVLGQTAAGAQRTFNSPEEAFKALAEAAGKQDEAALLDILGQEHRDLVILEDRAQAREGRERFYERYKEYSQVILQADGRAVLQIGKLGWPFPIPAVKEGAVWRLDTAAGREEILNRRIGENELMAIRVCRAYVDGQRAYAKVDRDGDDVLEYAQRIPSTPGKRDGLYWESGPGEEMSPFGPLIAEQKDYMEGRKAGDPYYGYYYKILTKQGGNVAGGRYDYVINGNMIAGFALVAYPAEYGRSGIMTFVVNHQGRVHEKDQGPDSEEKGQAMKEYNPDPGWKLVKEDKD
jgi:hypothetical protein